MIWFKNRSLKEKLILTITVVVIIPLLFIGMILSWYTVSVIRGNICGQRTEALVGGIESLEEYFSSIQHVSVEVGENSSAARVMKSDAFITDYIKVRQWIDSLYQNNTGYKNISLSNGEEIFMQAGTYIDKEDKTAIAEIAEKNIEEMWTLPRTLEISPYVITEGYSLPVLTYYSKVSPYYNWKEDQCVISVSISEEILRENYVRYLGSDFINCSLVRKDGKILSSTDDSTLGQDYGQHEIISERLESAESGYVKAGGNYYFYAGSDEMGFYLTECIPSASVEMILLPIILLFLGALILCLIFGSVFTLIQHRCMVLPLKQLLQNITQVQEGNFALKKQEFNKDEIGTLNERFQEMSLQLQKMLREVYLSKINEQEAEIQALISQINPHFLYNTLDSIHWKAVKCRAYDVADQIEALSEMYKYILSKDKKVITLQEELTFLENYFFIMKARYGKRIEFIIEAEEYKKTEIPKLILQPLIENAVFHGLEPSDEGGYVWIKVYREDRDVIILVRDNGVGTDGESLMKKIQGEEQDGEALALKNIDRRMRLYYGEEYGIRIVSTLGCGCEVFLRIPCVKEGDETDANDYCR